MSAILSPLLQQFPWLRHGFGTRDDPTTQQDMVSLKQVHSNHVLVADRGVSSGVLGEADALTTNQPDLTISIRTADCVPVLLVDVRSHGVSAIHAGWRGTVAGIIGTTINRMREEYGSRAEDLYAAIGPAIGKCCYEVSEDVARQFGESAGLTGKANLDLPEHNRRQLLAAGLALEHVEILAYCTRCDAERFYSYRRDGEQAGRMITFIATIPGPSF